MDDTAVADSGKENMPNPTGNRLTSVGAVTNHFTEITRLKLGTKRNLSYLTFFTTPSKYPNEMFFPTQKYTYTC